LLILIVVGLNSIAKTLAIDVFSDGNTSIILSAQEMLQDIIRGNNIGTAIAEELESCCKEIKHLLIC
jgi:hypothetical protein